MPWHIARNPDNVIQSIQTDDGMSQVYRLTDKGWTIYRIEPAANGRFTLIPQQLTGVVTEEPVITTDGTLEDVP